MDNQVHKRHQPALVWRRRQAVAASVLVLVIFGVSPAFLIRFDSGITLWIAISSVWLLGIVLTWLGGRIQIVAKRQAKGE